MGFPSWLSWYKKPEYRDIKEYSTAIRSGSRPASPEGRNTNGIPSRLKLERILDNKTCSPMSLYDFYMYLKYIEFSAENLEFYIWYKNYEKSYAETGSIRDFGEKDMASSHGSVSELNDNPPSVESMDFSLDPEVAKETLDRISALLNPGTICAPIQGNVESVKPSADTFGTQSTTAFTPGPNLKSQQRAELQAVLQTFVVPQAPKELNIPPSLRDKALAGLETSSDPIHLRPIADHIYQLLRNCSHRNFVRLGVSNGTLETICMATGLGIVLTFVGFLFVFLRAFVPFKGSHTRWEVFGAWPLWWLGMSLILSGIRGSCFFLLLFSRRQPLPWERFDDSASVLSRRSGILKMVSRLMILDRKIRVKDVHLRKLQTKIVIQSLIGGAIFASLGVVLFIFLPMWEQTTTS